MAVKIQISRREELRLSPYTVLETIVSVNFNEEMNVLALQSIVLELNYQQNLNSLPNVFACQERQILLFVAEVVPIEANPATQR